MRDYGDDNDEEEAIGKRIDRGRRKKVIAAAETRFHDGGP